MQINTKYSVGDIAYIALYSTARVYPVTVDRIRISKTGSVSYDLRRNDNQQVIENTIEDDVLSFASAKSKLATYLTDKLAELDSMVA